LPNLLDDSVRQDVFNDQDLSSHDKERFLEIIDAAIAGYMCLEERGVPNSSLFVHNLNLSQCYNCKQIAVWVHDRLIFPPNKLHTQPNNDLPEDIKRDFNEAREIVDLSPRGAAALLRLCVQKLCKNLGEKGENIDADIGSLVKKGLSPTVQKALDIVRVIGNEAVHPGVLDLKDNRDVAVHLFGLVNAVCEQMISHPKKVEELYSSIIPERNRHAIERRDHKRDVFK
jgi:hypothetical protein